MQPLFYVRTYRLKSILFKYIKQIFQNNLSFICNKKFFMADSVDNIKNPLAYFYKILSLPWSIIWNKRFRGGFTMEKINSAQSAAAFSKENDKYERIIFSLNIRTIFALVCSVLFSSISVFSAMSPFGIAFYTAVFSKEAWIINFIGTAASYLLFGGENAGIYAASLMLITAVLAIFDFGGSALEKGGAASGIFFSARLLSLALGSFIPYDFFALFIETALIFLSVYIFDHGFKLLCTLRWRSLVSTAESICTMSFLSLLALSLSALPTIYGFKLSNVLSVLIIYIFCLGGINGGGVIMGVLFGAIGSISSELFYSYTGSFAFGALLASVFACYGRAGIALGFVIANTAASLLLSDGGDVGGILYDSFAASVIFMLIPPSFCSHLSAVFDKSRRTVSDELGSLRHDDIQNRLNEMSMSFKELSKLYDAGSAKRNLSNDYIKNKFDSVIASACIACPNKKKCFGTASSRGYANMKQMLDTAFKNGRVSPKYLPTEFAETCRRCDSFCEKFNSMFAVIKTEKQWVAKINDSRQLVSEQLLAISQSLEKEAKSYDYQSSPAFEEKLWAELDKERLAPQILRAKQSKNGGFMVHLGYKADEISEDIILRLSEILGGICSVAVCSSPPERHGDFINYTFYPVKSYSVTVGYASKAKNGETASGDNFGIIEHTPDAITAMLSDGMGSGAQAGAQSSYGLKLMQKFVNLGFDCDTAVRLINSSLLLKSTRESFTTIDLCRVNTSNAEIAFTKLGASKSYIKSADGITSIGGGNLPVGILREVQSDKYMLPINSDTIIVMMSDGVGDIALKNEKLSGWIERSLEEIKSSNPQLIASKLMERALSLQNGEAGDDMTVMVLSIKKV